MTKSRNFKRALAVITVLAMVICLAQTVVFASNTVDVKDGSYNGTEVSVTGSISTKGAEMTMLAVRTDDPNVALSSYAERPLTGIWRSIYFSFNSLALRRIEMRRTSDSACSLSHARIFSASRNFFSLPRNMDAGHILYR